MSKTTKIALLLNITELEARAFCLAVQKEFRDGGVPSFRVITDYLEKYKTTRHAPVELARIIKQNHTHGKLHQPLVPLHKPRQKPTRKQKRKSPSLIDVDKRKLRPISPIMAYDPRRFTENLPKCPHGVLRIRKCAICDPDGFRLEHGWD